MSNELSNISDFALDFNLNFNFKAYSGPIYQDFMMHMKNLSSNSYFKLE